jgi:hypothetical protein
MVIKLKKKDIKYTLQKCFIDITSKQAKTIYKQLEPNEYSEARILALKEIDQMNRRI